MASSSFLTSAEPLLHGAPAAAVLRKPGQKYRFSAPPDGGEALLSTFHSLNFEAGVQRVHSLWGAR